MKKVIITHDLKVFYGEGRNIVQRDLSNINDINNVICFCEDNGLKTFKTLGGIDRWIDFETLTLNRAIPSGFPKIQYYEDGKCSFTYLDKYGRANHLSGLDFVSEERNLWETFKLMDIDTFRSSIKIVVNKWVIGSINKIVSVDIKKSNFNIISFGDMSIDIDSLFSKSKFNNKKLKFIFFDGWKVYEAFLFKPVIILIVFGMGDTLRQYAECIRSIELLGEYDGDIIIISNNDSDNIIGIAPEKIQRKINVINMQGIDQLDYVGARLSIFNTNILDEYQPIIYSDVDIVFDKNINYFLIESVKYSKCSAQIEPFHKIEKSEHTGGSLVKNDPFFCEDFLGFNGGLLLIPNIENHGRYLQAAYRVLVEYTSKFGRDSIPFYDQSVLNYTLYKLENFDGNLVSNYTQIGGYDYPVDPKKPRGFVHFWNTREKSIDMSSYIESVRDIKSSKQS